jgi:hypothetical protein
VLGVIAAVSVLVAVAFAIEWVWVKIRRKPNASNDASAT